MLTVFGTTQCSTSTFISGSKFEAALAALTRSYPVTIILASTEKNGPSETKVGGQATLELVGKTDGRDMLMFPGEIIGSGAVECQRWWTGGCMVRVRGFFHAAMPARTNDKAVRIADNLSPGSSILAFHQPPLPVAATLSIPIVASNHRSYHCVSHVHTAGNAATNHSCHCTTRGSIHRQTHSLPRHNAIADTNTIAAMDTYHKWDHAVTSIPPLGYNATTKRSVPLTTCATDTPKDHTSLSRRFYHVDATWNLYLSIMLTT